MPLLELPILRSLLLSLVGSLEALAILGDMHKLVGKSSIRTTFQGSSIPTTIDTLPDDALIQIFDFCRVGRNPLGSPFHPILEWHRLIHVCQRWRRIIFSSPRRLDLYILCTSGTPVRKNLGHWPAFPIIIDYVNYHNDSSEAEILSSNDENNIIAALENPDRVRCLKLSVTSLLLRAVATVAKQPFPILTQLLLSSNKDENVSVLPSTFLGGFAPLLQEIHFESIPFPTLPTLLSSATDLIVLHLHHIPHTGYFSPEAMVASLGTLIRLEDLYIAFQSHTSRPNQSSNGRRVAPVMRAVLPALNSFEFRGASEYLEDLVAQCDAPRLTTFSIWFFNQLTFQVPQLFSFASRAQILEQAPRMDAEVFFNENLVYINFYHGPVESWQIPLDLQISCQGLDWQVSHLAAVLSQCSAILFNVGHLSIDAYDLPQILGNETDHIEWLELFHHFTAVESLEVSIRLSEHVANVLKDVTVEMVPEFLPSLQFLCLENLPLGCVEEFITARRVSGRPIIFGSSLYHFLSQRGSRLWRYENP